MVYNWGFTYNCGLQLGLITGVYNWFTCITGVYSNNDCGLKLR